MPFHSINVAMHYSHVCMPTFAMCILNLSEEHLTLRSSGTFNNFSLFLNKNFLFPHVNGNFNTIDAQFASIVSIFAV